MIHSSFDVHHGDGTEEIVRLLTPKIHEVKADFSTFVRSDYKPWLDQDLDASHVFFASAHSFAHDFFPFSGDSCRQDEGKPIHNIALKTPARYKAELRELAREKLLEPLAEFRPDIVFISAGFDAHEKDQRGNNVRFFNYIYINI